MDDNRKGALLIILAGTCWGVISIFINYLSSAGLGEMQISFLRQLFAVLVFGLIILIRDRSKFRIPVKDLGLLMLVGFINGVIVAVFRIPAMLVTLGVQMALTGISLGITRGGTLSGYPDSLERA